MTRMRIPHPPVKPPATSREQTGPRRPTWDHAPDRPAQDAQDAENTQRPSPPPQRLSIPRDRLWFTKFRKRWDDPVPADLADATDAAPAVESAAHDAAPASAATLRQDAEPGRTSSDQPPDRSAEAAEDTQRPSPPPQRPPSPRDLLWFTRFRKRWNDPMPADLADATDAAPRVASAAHDAAPPLRQDTEPGRTSSDHPPARSAGAEDTQKPSPPPQRPPIPGDRWWIMKIRKRWDDPVPAERSDAAGPAPAVESAAHDAAATLRQDTEPGRTSWDHPPDRPDMDADDVQRPSPPPQRLPFPGGDRLWFTKFRKRWDDPVPAEPSSAGEPTAPARSGTAVQLRAAPGGAATLTASEVHAAAAAGIRDSGEPLPYGDRIQRAFGPDHDLSQVTAHVGGAATAAAAQLRANAYTAGEHIAFASAPDLRLAAHEAAHVVQQRTGVALSRGVGRSGDSYEQSADAVAERVAAGRSATGLLPPAAATRGHPPAVQLDEQRGAAAPAHDDASNDTDVDIEWVGNLDPKLLDEIDVYYSDAKARNASAAATRDQLRAVKATSPADAAWQKHQIAIAGERRKADAAADLDQTVESHHRAETAVDPSGPVITRGEGQRIARRNFVKWTAALFGSVDKAKEHYRSIKSVPGLSILLTDKAGERLLAAKKEFEAAHPGFTFLPGGGFSMRDLHEARNGVGMLGHALGVAIDIHATQNPNIKLPKETGLGNYEYLIARAGADASGHPGRVSTAT